MIVLAHSSFADEVEFPRDWANHAADWEVNLLWEEYGRTAGMRLEAWEFYGIRSMITMIVQVCGKIGNLNP